MSTNVLSGLVTGVRGPGGPPGRRGLWTFDLAGRSVTMRLPATASFDAGDLVVVLVRQRGERLGGIALNCRLIGDPERNVLVPSEDMIETKYEVVCTDQVGNLRLVTSTTGLFPDADGYEIVIESGSPITMRNTEVKTVGSVAAGVTQVRLLESSVADNCTLQGENPRTLDVPAGGLIDTLFEVTCVVP